jgi:hypothetical protein
MTLRVVIGVDPGLDGGLAAIADGALVKLRDMPTKTKEVRKRCKRGKDAGQMKTFGKRSVDADQVADFVTTLLADHPGADVCCFSEFVTSRQGEGVSTAFKFGRSDGIIEGVMAGKGIPYVRVTSITWKKQAGIPPKSDKSASIAIAIARHPNATGVITKKKHDGRADAILIADHGYAKRSA